MGVIVYWLIVVAVILLGQCMPQSGRRRKSYIVLMAVLHAFVCGFRYMYMHGDLRKYASSFYWVYPGNGWFSDSVFSGGRNFGFAWLNKFIAGISGGDFQLLLLVIAIITEVTVAIVIYRYSPKPWLSYVVWNCMGFYIFGFSGIKQALAMGLLMMAYVGIAEKNKKKFYLWTLLAGAIHIPALCFLPANFIANRRVNNRTIIGYVLAIVLIFVFRRPLVTLVSQFYYEDKSFIYGGSVGGRFLMLLLIALMGLVLRGTKKTLFSQLMNLMIVAAICQMFSSFDYIFSRLADYYFQFSILYIPMLIYDNDVELPSRPGLNALITIKGSSKQIVAVVLVLACVWFYNSSYLSKGGTGHQDDITNYRFSWEVDE